MLDIRIISDIHLESWDQIPNNIFPDGDNKEKILILAGDVGDPYKKLYKEFLITAKSLFKNVILIPGNREYYNKDINKKNKIEVDSIPRNKNLTNYSVDGREKIMVMSEINRHLENLCKEIGIIYLNKSFCIINNYIICGVTLWTDIPDVLVPSVLSNNLNVFKHIHVTSDKLTYDQYVNIHKSDKKWLNDFLISKQNLGKKIIVVTHHPPTNDFQQPRQYDDFFSRMNVNDLHEMFYHNVKLWICGHVHHSLIMRKGGTILCSNPFGDIKQNDNYCNYDRNFHISI